MGGGSGRDLCSIAAEMSTDASDAREQFLQALRNGDAGSLAQVVADDFTFVDPESSAVVGQQRLIDLVSNGVLRFESIEVLDDNAAALGTDETRFKTRIRLSGRMNETRYDGEYRLLELYRKHGEIWKAVLSSARPA